VEAVSTKAAGRFASRLFFVPPRTARPPTSSFESSARFEIDFGRDRLAAWSLGVGARTALLVHGWGGRASQLRAFAEPLQTLGYRIIAFDAPAHGLSTGLQLTLPEFAAAIRRVADVVGPVDLVIAHSFGAAATSVAVARGLPVGRAVLIGPPANELPWFERFAVQLGLSERTQREARKRAEHRIGAPFSAFDADVLGPSLKVPVLVVHDRLDDEVPWADGARLARAAPNARLLTTEGLGHRRTLRDPQVLSEVTAFAAEKPLRANAELELHCRQCGKALGERWDDADTLCMQCGLQYELSCPSSRWDSVRAA
jgi:pimeloyl-ACP methyl ester carboxylesterase